MYIFHGHLISISADGAEICLDSRNWVNSSPPTYLPGFLEAKIARLWLLGRVHATIETPGSHTRGALPPLPYHTTSYHMISYHLTLQDNILKISHDIIPHHTHTQWYHARYLTIQQYHVSKIQVMKSFITFIIFICVPRFLQGFISKRKLTFDNWHHVFNNTDNALIAIKVETQTVDFLVTFQFLSNSYTCCGLVSRPTWWSLSLLFGFLKWSFHNQDIREI